MHGLKKNSLVSAEYGLKIFTSGCLQQTVGYAPPVFQPVSEMLAVIEM